MTTGYDGPDAGEDEEAPSPTSVSWRIERMAMHSEEAIHCRILIDGEPCGMVRVPNNEYLRHIRERLQHEPA